MSPAVLSLACLGMALGASGLTGTVVRRSLFRRAPW